MAKVKCLYCGQLFDRTKEECVKIGRRYAHFGCYDNFHSPDDDFKEQIFSLVKTLFGPNYDYVTIERQRAQYVKDGLSNEEIFNALYYHYVIKEASIAGAKGRIGIVPYIMEEAKEYYAKKTEAIERISRATPLKEIEIGVEKLRGDTKPKKDLIDLSDLE